MKQCYGFFFFFSFFFFFFGFHFFLFFGGLTLDKGTVSLHFRFFFLFFFFFFFWHASLLDFQGGKPGIRDQFIQLYVFLDGEVLSLVFVNKLGPKFRRTKLSFTDAQWGIQLLCPNKKDTYKFRTTECYKNYYALYTRFAYDYTKCFL